MQTSPVTSRENRWHIRKILKRTFRGNDLISFPFDSTLPKVQRLWMKFLCWKICRSALLILWISKRFFRVKSQSMKVTGKPISYFQLCGSSYRYEYAASKNLSLFVIQLVISLLFERRNVDEIFLKRRPNHLEEILHKVFCLHSTQIKFASIIFRLNWRGNSFAFAKCLSN